MSNIANITAYLFFFYLNNNSKTTSYSPRISGAKRGARDVRALFFHFLPKAFLVVPIDHPWISLSRFLASSTKSVPI